MRQFLSILLLIFIISCSEKKDPLVQIQEDVEYLASDELGGREVGTEGEKKAADYVANRMVELGLEPKGEDAYFQNFYFKRGDNPHATPTFSDSPLDSGNTAYNVLGFMDNPGDDIIVIGAHFDHLGRGGISSLERGSTEIHNGADDNASGTAAVLELSRIFSESEIQSDLLFFAITGEEQGLWGSNHFTKNPTVDLENVNYMINMDMVGRLDSTRGLAIYGTGTAPVWEDEIASANAENLKIISKESGTGPSDHTSFYLKDIPVLHFFTGQHEDYHKPSDDPDKINYKGIKTVTEMIERIVRSLDDQPKLTFQKTKDESSNTPKFTVTLGVMPDYMNDEEGMLIASVSEDKPAIKAGLMKGDIVVQLGDSSVTDMMSYMRALSAFQPGDQTTVKVKRGEDLLRFEVEF